MRMDEFEATSIRIRKADHILNHIADIEETIENLNDMKVRFEAGHDPNYIGDDLIAICPVELNHRIPGVYIDMCDFLVQRCDRRIKDLKAEFDKI